MAKVFGFSRSGFIIGFVISIKSIDATSTVRSLIVKYEKYLLIKRNAVVQGVFKKNLKKMAISKDSCEL